jgi:hypothetical protein
MKFEQLKPFVGQLVTLQLNTPWWAMGYRGTTPAGHLCHAATHQVADEKGEPKQALVGPMDLIGPVMIELDGLAVVITHASPDGTTLKTGCDPEAIAFVNLCVAPPPKAEPKIILSS